LIRIIYIQIKMSSLATKKIFRLARRQAEMLELLLAASPFLRGSFARVSTRCGKPNCWCAKRGGGHLHARLTWCHDSKAHTRKVTAEQEGRVVSMTADYRSFRRLRQQLRAIVAEIERSLDRLEEDLARQGGRSMPSLRIPTERRKSSPKSADGVQKTPKQGDVESA